MTKCFGFHLTKTRKILLLVLGLVAIIGLGIVPFQLSVYSYAKKVPIQLGYNEAQEHWILSSVISEKERFKMVLEAEATDDVTSETQAKTESEVGLLLDPLLPISETNLEVTDYKYKSKLPHGFTWTWEYTKAPVYDVNDAGWLTTARYRVGVYKNTVKITEQDVNINYKEPKVLKLETSDGEVTITNLGILPQGVEVPSGDLMVMRDPNLHEHVVAKADVVQMLQRWDEYNGGTWYVRGTTLSWSDLWNWARNNGYLPADVNLVHVSTVEYIEDMDYVRLYYADIVFAGDITVYIPTELADTVIVNLYQPKPQITSVTTDPAAAIGKDLPSVDEGDDFTLSITIKNVGTEGSISTTIQSERYAANPITETFANFDEGESLTFRWKIYALNVVEDTPAELRVYAQGRGGDDQKILKGTILDVQGYTPPDPPPPPDPVPPSSGEFPWFLLVLGGVGAVVIWYVWRRKK